MKHSRTAVHVAATQARAMQPYRERAISKTFKEKDAVSPATRTAITFQRTDPIHFLDPVMFQRIPVRNTKFMYIWF